MVDKNKKAKQWSVERGASERLGHLPHDTAADCKLQAAAQQVEFIPRHRGSRLGFQGTQVHFIGHVPQLGL